MRAIVLVALLIVAGVAKAQDDKAARIRGLEAEVAKLEARLTAARKELESLKPRPRVRVPNLQLLRLEIGHVGPFWGKGMIHDDFSIWRIINEQEMIVHPDRRLREMVILRMPTKGLADGRYLSYTTLLGEWEVVETKKVDGSTRAGLPPRW